MRTALLLVGFGAAAFAGVLAGQALGPGDVAPPPMTSGLEGRIDQLEREVARLTEMVRSAPLPPLPSSMPDGPDALAPSSPAARAEEASPTATPDELREKVLDVIEEKRQADREERERKVAEYAARAETARLDRLEKDLGLEPYQREELAKILTERRKAITALMRGRRERIRAPEAREEMKEEFKRIREEADTELQKLLSTEQYEAFKKRDDQAVKKWTKQDRGRRGGRRGR
jgi:hypothetical protein